MTLSTKCVWARVRAPPCSHDYKRGNKIIIEASNRLTWFFFSSHLLEEGDSTAWDKMYNILEPLHKDGQVPLRSKATPCGGDRVLQAALVLMGEVM